MLRLIQSVRTLFVWTHTSDNFVNMSVSELLNDQSLLTCKSCLKSCVHSSTCNFVVSCFQVIDIMLTQNHLMMHMMNLKTKQPRKAHLGSLGNVLILAKNITMMHRIKGTVLEIYYFLLLSYNV